MSAGWDDYLNAMISECRAEKAAILGLDGSVWSQTPNTNLQAGEITTLAKLFDDPSPAYTEGIYVEQERYSFLRGSPEFLVAAKGKFNLLISKANQCMLLVITSPSDQNEGKASIVALENINNYLRENGY